MATRITQMIKRNICAICAYLCNQRFLVVPTLIRAYSHAFADPWDSALSVLIRAISGSLRFHSRFTADGADRTRMAQIIKRKISALSELIRVISGSLRFHPRFTADGEDSAIYGDTDNTDDYKEISAQSAVSCDSNPHSCLFARIRGSLWFHSRFTADDADRTRMARMIKRNICAICGFL
jgi:hypothetical protein